jgi:RNA polymerase-binding transcription factor DksA
MTATAASALPFIEQHFLVRQRHELTVRRSAYREQVERLSAAADELTTSADPPDLGDDDGFGEGDSINMERDRLQSLTAEARRRIDEVDAALHRLDAGTYGACRSCRQAIPAARLHAVPEATQCVACASGSVLRRR